jgi:hypothetical protein
MAAEDIVVHDYLDATEYGDGTLLDFFERDKSEFEDEDTIRELYPIVKALTAGQIAGLDFLSVKDMILMAITDENGFKEAKIENVSAASIYQDVNREIYDRGGVALTDDALRAQASAQEANNSFKLSKMGIVLWCCTAVAGFAAAGSVIAMVKLKPNILKEADSLRKAIASAKVDYKNATKFARSSYRKIVDLNAKRELQNIALDKHNKATTRLNDLEKSGDFKDAARQYSAKSTICKYLAAGFSLAMAILAGVSIYTTIKELIDYYKVKFAPIPKYIVERTDITAKNKKGKETMIRNQSAYYKVVPCNRTEGNSDVEKENY